MPEISNPRSGLKSAIVSANKTLTAADSGIVQEVTKDVTVTLPATANGVTFSIQVSADAITGKTPTVTVAPAAADGITGNGYTAAVNKAVINNKATGRVGDVIVLHGTGTAGVTGWVVDAVVGEWTRAA